MLISDIIIGQTETGVLLSHEIEFVLEKGCMQGLA